MQRAQIVHIIDLGVLKCDQSKCGSTFGPPMRITYVALAQFSHPQFSQRVK